nr:pentatricopeptide repeat-containing protein At3g62890-like [Ipomoea batatas]
MRGLSRTRSLFFPKPSNFSSSTSFPAIPILDNANSNFHPTVKSFSQLLIQRPPISQLKQIHTQILTLSLSSHPSLTNSLIHCYHFAHDLSSAKLLFNKYPLPTPPILIWNLMIRAYSKLQNSLEPIYIFRKMLALDHPFRVIPDEYTFTFLITSCAHQMSLVHGVIAHGLVMKIGYGTNLYVANSLVNMYGIFKRTDDACMVFDEMPERDVFSWTSLVCGYAKNGEMSQALEAFGKMPVRNDVSWAVMVSGFVGSGRYMEALRCFREMLSGSEHKVKPNEAVLVCALSACAHLGALEQGNWIHTYIDKSGIPYTSNVFTALVDMYAKCGRIDCAELVFNKITRPDVHNFTSMISGLSIHGLGKDAFTVFNRMLDEKISPNKVTILGVLNGCSHSGLVEEGSSVFYNMESSWGIEPKIEHYGCYVDLLGRAGYLEKAFEVVQSMPMEPDIILWRALLSACRIHRNADLGESIINYIKGLGSCGSSGGEVLLSNLYASLGRWEKVIELRKAMGERKTQPDIGCSWIEVNGVVHEFRVAEKLHSQILEIQEKLKEVLNKAREAGYVANTMHVSFDLIEEEKEHAVAWHSEKLAVAYGLLSTMSGTTIRIVKNLRTCEDCHSALKAISKVYKREIIVRDRSRFHTFRGGNCLCNDYW